MQDDFGKKLEDARTRQGISLREAARATRIRSDFLESFENNHGKFEMPEVYKRGFLKLYARYLKLDVEEIYQSYLDYQKSYPAAKRDREYLNRLNLVQGTKATEGAEEGPNFPQPSDPAPYQANPHDKRDEPTIDQDTKVLYIKVGLGVAAALCVFAAIAVTLTRTKSSSSESTQESAQVASSTTKEASTPKAAKEEEITFAGTNDVHLVVRRESDKKRLFAGKLKENEPVKVTRTEPIKVHFSNGTHLQITKSDGTKVKPNKDGIGWIKI